MNIYYYEKKLDLKESDFFWETDQMLDDDRYEQWKGQREKFGFDEREVWNLYYRIALFIYPRLKMFRDYMVSRPHTLTEKEWEDILNSMLISFELIIKDKEQESEENRKIVQRGLNLFSEYFLNLWD